MKLPFKTILTIDFETTWDRKQGLSLSKQTMEEYLRDPRFKPWGACVHEFGTDKATQWYRDDELPRVLNTYDMSTTAILGQNTMFDGAILNWRYGIKPALLLDTLCMARAVRGVEAGNSLAKLAQDLGLPDKGTGLASSEGYLDYLPPDIERELAEYCAHDVYLTEKVFEHFLPEFTSKELRLIDMTLRMYTEAELLLDADMLVHALEEERTTREGLLARLGVTDKELASNDVFARLLHGLGIDPPTKPKKPTKKNPNPEGYNWAFAKTDAMFQAMLHGDNDEIAMLCEARLKVKSTTERTRAQRFYDISQRGTLPVPLTYYGARSGRWTACLVADTEVIVYDRHNGQCVKRIVDVLPDDLVWDGVEFVQHEGVQFSGYKEVMSYDGVTGTPDHKVFITDDTTVSLQEARKTGARIMDAPKPDDRAVEAARARLKRLRW